jgi:hypothetical protein
VLSQTGSPIMPGETPYLNSHSTIKRYRPASTAPVFASPHALPQTHFLAPQKPLKLNTAAQPFDKRMASQIHHSLTRAIHNPSRVSQPPSYYQPPAPLYQQPPQQQFYQQSPLSYQSYSNLDASFSPQASRSSFLDYSQDSQGPMWSSTLKRTGIDLVQPEQHASSLAFTKPAAAPTFHVGSFSNSSAAHNSLESPSKSPKIVNLQYNSPIGLYSNNKIKEELQKQVG